MQNGIAKLDLLDIEESNKKFVDSTSEDMPKVSDVNIALHDPPLIATKGRPRTLRMKSSLEMVRKGSSTCSYCMKKGHTKPKCPNLNQTRYLKITCTCLLIFFIMLILFTNNILMIFR